MAHEGNLADQQSSDAAATVLSLLFLHWREQRNTSGSCWNLFDGREKGTKLCHARREEQEEQQRTGLYVLQQRQIQFHMLTIFVFFFNAICFHLFFGSCTESPSLELASPFHLGPIAPKSYWVFFPCD